jgi:4,5:9,10-diseco-3-hydroxy-5,9,17-trioxoandrosta-1(10),2-diene-4-oate hydrolase
VLPVAHAQVGVDQMVNARLHLFDRCGHFPQFEYPSAFNALVTEFLTPAIVVASGLPYPADEQAHIT